MSQLRIAGTDVSCPLIWMSVLTQWQRKDKLGSDIFRADDIDIFMVGIDDLFDDRQSKTGAFFVLSTG